mmetsp:Transcript_28953/g.75057  ORF Transcript_28953/g.75057 Transcript_28953/m.75057 type:complete len:252 (+) Transcript_28953:2033-2788(+)
MQARRPVQGKLRLLLIQRQKLLLAAPRLLMPQRALVREVLQHQQLLRIAALAAQCAWKHGTGLLHRLGPVPVEGRLHFVRRRPVGGAAVFGGAASGCGRRQPLRRQYHVLQHHPLPADFPVPVRQSDGEGHDGAVQLSDRLRHVGHHLHNAPPIQPVAAPFVPPREIQPLRVDVGHRLCLELSGMGSGPRVTPRADCVNERSIDGGGVAGCCRQGDEPGAPHATRWSVESLGEGRAGSGKAPEGTGRDQPP